MCPSAWVVLCVVVHMCVVCVCLCAWEKSWKKQGSSKAQKYYFPTIVYDTLWSFNGSLHSRTFLEQLKRVDIKLVYKKNSWIDNKNQRQSLFYQTSEIYEIFEFSQLSNCSMLFCHYKVRIKIENQLTSETHLVSMPKRKKFNYGLHEPNSKIFLWTHLHISVFNILSHL